MLQFVVCFIMTMAVIGTALAIGLFLTTIIQWFLNR